MSGVAELAGGSRARQRGQREHDGGDEARHAQTLVCGGAYRSVMLKRWLTAVPIGPGDRADHDLAQWTATDFTMPKPEVPFLLPSAFENAWLSF